MRIGTPVQYLLEADTYAAIITRVFNNNEVALRVFYPDGRDGETVIGVPLHDDAHPIVTGTWKPLPITAQPVAELRVNTLLDALEPLVNAAVALCVDAELERRGLKNPS